MWPKVFRNHVFSRFISDMALSQLQEVVAGVVAKGCYVKLIFGKTEKPNLNRILQISVLCATYIILFCCC